MTREPDIRESYASKWSVKGRVPRRAIVTFRLFISHRYKYSPEYQRLVRMLDNAARRDRHWKWRNYSVPQDAMIKTDGDVMWADVLVRSLRQRISMVHAVLYILRDDWLDELGNLYEEIVEATVSKFETQVPIVCVLPRGADVHSLKYTPPGVATVKWSSAAIIRAVRKHALPVLASEMRMTRSQSVERARIRSCIKANAGAVGRTAAALHMSRKTLKQKMLSYIIR